MQTRTEYDLLGEQQVPAEAWYGIQTQRAKQNFNITGVPISHFPELIRALAMVKAAAARANHQLGLLPGHKAEAIEAACADIIRGELHDQFIVDLIQGGAGTSTNMNANEVIANLALSKLGHERGRYKELHPNNDVNRSQSTNDAYPTAARLAIVFAAQPLKEAIAGLQHSLADKGREFAHVLKMGRTQLQDAVPMTLGRSSRPSPSTWARKRHASTTPAACCARSTWAAPRSAPGSTPIRATPLAVNELADIGRAAGEPAGNLVEATSDMGAFVPSPACSSGCGQAVQDQQRPAPAVQRPAHRPGRDQPAGRSPAPPSCPARSTR
jgi:aspartate ammonia-lyase